MFLTEQFYSLNCYNCCDIIKYSRKMGSMIRCYCVGMHASVTIPNCRLGKNVFGCKAKNVPSHLSVFLIQMQSGVLQHQKSTWRYFWLFINLVNNFSWFYYLTLPFCTFMEVFLQTCCQALPNYLPLCSKNCIVRPVFQQFAFGGPSFCSLGNFTTAGTKRYLAHKIDNK